MKTELIVALISGAVALAAAGIAIWGQSRSARLASDLERLRLAEQRRIETQTALARYREPLVTAAHDLQSRLYNILEQGLIGTYLENGDERERAYVVENTVFLVGQYFAWTEIIRRDIQYIDLGSDAETRELARLQHAIFDLFRSDRFSPVFRVFAGEQRAIGERMIRDTPRGPECMGYASFLDRATPDPLLEPIRADVRDLGARLQDARPRLVALQNALIDLLAFLDPGFVRFPESQRTKVAG